MPPDSHAHTTHSSSREKILEHLLIGQILKEMWLRGQRNIEVLRPDIDNGGYDIVLSHGGTLRFIQLKSTRKGGKAAHQKLNESLAAQPGGCVVWMFFDEDTLAFTQLLWLGNPPGQKLSQILDYPRAKHTKGNAQGKKSIRKRIRKANKGQFQKVATIQQLIPLLFPSTTSET